MRGVSSLLLGMSAQGKWSDHHTLFLFFPQKKLHPCHDFPQQRCSDDSDGCMFDNPTQPALSTPRNQAHTDHCFENLSLGVQTAAEMLS